jgi:hypothetical protein
MAASEVTVDFVTGSETSGAGIEGRSIMLWPSSALLGMNDVIPGWEGERVCRVLFDRGVACVDSDERLTLFEDSLSGVWTGTCTGFLDNSSYRTN